MRSVNIRPGLCGMCPMVCGTQCGIKLLILKACAACAVSGVRTHGRMQAGACACRRAPVHTCTHTAHTAHTAHATIHAGLRSLYTAHLSPTYRTKKKWTAMKEEKQAQVVIACTEENAGDFRRLVREMPQLQSLVAGLQTQGLFPGLRAMQITLTGSAEFVAGGVAGVVGESGLLARQQLPNHVAKGGVQ